MRAPVRGGAVWQLVGLITRRSQVRILPPLPTEQLVQEQPGPFGALFCSCKVAVAAMASVHDRLQAMLEPLVESMGYELVLLEFSPHKGSAMVRLFIDAPGGITLGD